MRKRLLITGAVAAVTAALACWQLQPWRSHGAQPAKPLVTGQEAAPATAISHEPGTMVLQESLQGLSLELMRKIHARFNAGDFGTALQLADAAAGDAQYSAAFQTWLQAQLPVILVSAGWVQIKLGNCEAALPLFQRAAAVTRDENVTKGLAFCFYKARNFAAADENFSRYLNQAPADIAMSLLFADLLESESRFDRAHEVLQQALKHEPESAILRQRQASMKGKVKESQRQYSIASRYIHLTYNAEEHADIVDMVVNTLEQAVDEFIDRHSFRAPRDPLEVILYSDNSFRSIVNNGPSWAEGIFDGRMRIPIRPTYLDGSETAILARILRHELTHAMLATMTDFRDVPSWFNEGLAQRLECENGCKRQIFPATPGTFLSVESLLVPYSSYEAIKADRSYRQSLYLISLMENDERYPGSEAIAKIVANLSPTSDITSDGILAPLNIPFTKLHADASELWNERHPF